MSLSKLFRSSDNVYYTDNTMQGQLQPFTEEAPPGALFYAVNPLCENWQPHTVLMSKKPSGPRFSLNVSEYRNFVFESDRLPLADQLNKWTSITAELPVAQLTYSGGKSYHAVLSVLDSLELEPHRPESVQFYKQTWTAIATYLATKGLPVDHSTKDPARLTRLPGALRGQIEQAPVPIEARLISSEQIYTLINKYAPVTPTNQTLVAETHSLEELEKFLAKEQFKGLSRKIYLASNWANSENMYPALFRLTLWAIDTLRPPMEVWINLCERHVFPAIQAAGYRRNLHLPIKNAFLYKGFRV